MTAFETLGKVLITYGTRPLAQRVARLLPAGQPVVFGSADEVPEVLLRTGNYLSIPRSAAPAFVHEVLKVCLDRAVTTLVPLGANECYPMAEAKPLFAEYGIAVAVPDLTELESLVIIENPPRQLPLTLFPNGIFTPSDSGDEWALCCIAD